MFCSSLQHCWENIDLNMINKRIKLIPNGVEEVLKAKGGHIDYYPLLDEV